MFLAGLSGLMYVGLDLVYFDVRFLQSSAVAVAYHFAWHLMGRDSGGPVVYRTSEGRNGREGLAHSVGHTLGGI
jgi:hypothetical protein